MTEVPEHKILAVGADGMLGQVLIRFLAASPGIDVAGTVDNCAVPKEFPSSLASSLHTGMSEPEALRELLQALRPTVVINCRALAGDHHKNADIEQAILSNALLPHQLARLCAEVDARLIHISTDRVFTGREGNYREEDAPDSVDIYDRSHLLGEVTYGDSITIRTSVIGPEINDGSGLLSWLLNQKGNVPGYRTAVYAGMPTVELARVIRDYVLTHRSLRGLFHVSGRPVTEYYLLKLIQQAYDIDVNIAADDTKYVNRSLNSKQFRARTGYASPEWAQLIAEMKSFG